MFEDGGMETNTTIAVSLLDGKVNAQKCPWYCSFFGEGGRWVAQAAAAIECETSKLEGGPLFDNSAINTFQYLDIVMHIGTKAIEGKGA